MRPATKDDLKLAYDIFTDESVHPFMFYPPMPLEEYTKLFERRLKRGHFWVFQNEDGVDCAIASAIFYPGRSGHVAEIQAIGVKKEFQNQGIGRRMISQIIDTLKTMGAERIQLFAEADNPRAIALYEKLGFEEEGRMKKYFKRDSGEYIDEIVMGLLV